MPYANPHLSDRDLIMALDGELSVRRRAAISAHLDSCWSCRERMRSLDSTILEFVRARNRDFEGRMANAGGPRALLRTRLAEAGRVRLTWRDLVWRALPTVPVAALLGLAILIFGTTLGAEGPKPRASLTPGETRPITIGEVCQNPSAEVISPVSDDTRRLVFHEYGIRAHQEDFELDYLITPDLGGARSIRNLWPQPYSVRWNARAKDALEQRLHELVCNGRLDLTTAQRDIAADWIGAYKRYVGRTPPR